jgi:hypothetical protein
MSAFRMNNLREEQQTNDESYKQVIKIFEKIPKEIVVRHQKVALISGITGQVRSFVSYYILVILMISFQRMVVI